MLSKKGWTVNSESCQACKNKISKYKMCIEMRIKEMHQNMTSNYLWVIGIWVMFFPFFYLLAISKCSLFSMYETSLKGENSINYFSRTESWSWNAAWFVLGMLAWIGLSAFSQWVECCGMGVWQVVFTPSIFTRPQPWACFRVCVGSGYGQRARHGHGLKYFWY